MLRVVVKPDSFDAGAEIHHISQLTRQIGAVVCFIGQVRDFCAGDTQAPLQELYLEHYPGMTEATLTQISEEAAARWSLSACTVIHRVGSLLPGDPIVLVVTASAHREAAFQAAEFLMDYLKTKAPFWKRQRFTDGSTSWVAHRESDELAASRWLGSGPQ